MKGLRIVASSVVTVAMLLSMVACGGSTPSSSSASSSSSSSSSAASSKAASSSASTSVAASSSAAASSSVSASSSSSSSAAKKDVPKPKQLYLYVDVVTAENNGRDQVIKEFEKQTGIKLRIVQPEHSQYSDKLSTLFMSNDIPDIVQVASANYKQYAAQKVFAPIGNYIKNSEVMSKIDPKAIEVFDYKGSVYGIQSDYAYGAVTYIRKDWLDKLKIGVPKTYDEFYNMLVAFKDKDPDGNGANNDSIGYTLPLKDLTPEMFMTDLLMGARYDFYQKDGKWVDGFSEDAMLKALERMSKLYQEKLIEPEVFTMTTTDARNKFYTGNTGCFSYWSGSWNTTINTNLGRNIKDATVVAMPAMPGVKHINRINGAFCIPVKCASKSPEAVFKYFFEYIYDGGKGTMWACCGTEGVHYKMENGKPVALPALSTPDTKRELPVKNIMEGSSTLVPNPLYSFAIPKENTDSIKAFSTSIVQQSLIPPTKSYTSVAADITVLRAEVLAKVMKGEMTPAAGMDKYKAGVKKLGVDKIIADLNAF